MCRVQRIAEQYYIFKRQVRVFHQQEIKPLRIVRKQWLIRKILSKYSFEVIARFLIVHPCEAGRVPCFRIAFDDERAGGLVEFVRVGCKDTGFVFAERKRQAVEEFVGAVPDITIGTNIERGPKLSSVLLAGGA